MSRVATAPYDPVFYLHKTFVDFLWAYWQELQRLWGKKEKWRRELKKKYWDEPLHPFDRADFNENVKTLRHNKGRDVLDYKSNLCYEYEDLIYNGMTPAQLLKKWAGSGTKWSDWQRLWQGLRQRQRLWLRQRTWLRTQWQKCFSHSKGDSWIFYVQWMEWYFSENIILFSIECVCML